MNRMYRVFRWWGTPLNLSFAVNNPVWLVGLGLGFALRLLATPFGDNFDMQAWRFAAQVSREEWNVYLGTSLYNYGPVWYGILAGLKQLNILLFGDGYLSFRWLVAAVLIGTDALLARLLWRDRGPQAAWILALNPISILITGYHGQFCNLALLFGYLAVRNWQRGIDTGNERWYYHALLWLALSLITKHLLFLLPLWWALSKEKISTRIRWVALVLPWGLFLLSFAPFAWDGAGQQILTNVFRYRSFNNAPLYRLLLPESFFRWPDWPRLVFFASLAAGAGFARRVPTVSAFALYLLLLLVAAPAVTNQYLTIPTLALALLGLSPLAVVFMVYGAAWIVLDNTWYFLSHHVWQGFEQLYFVAGSCGYGIALLLLLFYALLHPASPLMLAFARRAA